MNIYGFKEKTMKRTIIVVGAAVVALGLLALGAKNVAAQTIEENPPYFLGSVDTTNYYVLLNDGNAPSANKNGVVLVNVLNEHTQTGNGAIAGGGNRLLFAVDCDEQMYKVTYVWTKRSASSQPVKNPQVVASLSEMEYSVIAPDTVAASVADYGCAYVSNNSKSTAPAEPKRKREIVTF